MYPRVTRKSRSKLALGALACLVLGVAAAGCTAQAVPRKEAAGRSKPAVPAGGLLIQGAGATFPSAIYETWFRAYQAEHSDKVIAYEPVGSGEGVRRFVGRNVPQEERVDFGASDAAMRDDEIASVSSGAVLVPVTAGSVALAYNLPDFPADLRLSRQAYTGIFLGEIKNWNDPRIARTNPGVKLPNLTITTVVRQEGSGTTFAFTKHLDAISASWRSQYGAATLVNWPGNSMRAIGNDGVAGRIKHSIGSIGYVGYESARRADLRVAILENNGGNFVGPAATHSMSSLAEAQLPENTRLFIADPSGAQSYPIVTLTWILLYRHYEDARRAQALHDLFRWCLTAGQRYAADLGYIPLPPNIVKGSLAALEQVQ